MYKIMYNDLNFVVTPYQEILNYIFKKQLVVSYHRIYCFVDAISKRTSVKLLPMEKDKKTKESMTFLWEIWRIKCMGNNNCGIPVLPVKETSDLSSKLSIRFKLQVNK